MTKPKNSTTTPKPEGSNRPDMSEAFFDLEVEVQDAKATANIVVTLYEAIFDKLDPESYAFAKPWEDNGYYVYAIPKDDIDAFSHAVYECNAKALDVSRKWVAADEAHR